MNKRRRDIKKAKEQEEAAAKAPRTLTILRDGLTDEQLRAVGVPIPASTDAESAGPPAETEGTPKTGGTQPQAGGTPLERAGQVMDVALDKIDDNPWQPRTTEDAAALRDLADNIAQVGLLQSPVGRARPGGRVQLAFGHRRVAAIRLLAAEGKWAGPVPVVVWPLTDAEALVEGVIRRVRRGPAPPGVDKETGEIKDSEGKVGE